MKQYSNCFLILNGDGMVNLTKDDGYNQINFHQDNLNWRSEALTIGQVARFLDLNKCFAEELTETQDVIVDETDHYHYGTVEYI